MPKNALNSGIEAFSVVGGDQRIVNRDRALAMAKFHERAPGRMCTIGRGYTGIMACHDLLHRSSSSSVKFRHRIWLERNTKLEDVFAFEMGSRPVQQVRTRRFERALMHSFAKKLISHNTLGQNSVKFAGQGTLCL